jgi:phosphate:Na+ symporter
MTTGFVGAGHIALAPGIAAAVGADLGSALLAILLRLDVSWLAPLCIVAGVAAFRGPENGRVRQYGRVVIGFGLLFLSLQLISAATQPLRAGEALPVILGLADDDSWLIFLLAALTAWLFHSSLAAILLSALLADQGILSAAMIAPVALGINFGGAMIALSLTRGVPREAVVPAANVVLRGLGAVVALLALGAVPLSAIPALAWIGALAPGTHLIALHIAFNAAILIAGLLVAGPLSRAIARLLVPRTSALAPLSALNEADLADPMLATGNVAREALALAGRIETMLAALPKLLRQPEESDFAAIAMLDREVDHQYRDIKLYVTRIAQRPDGGAQGGDIARLIHSIVKLEQAGDIIAQRVAVRARKKRERAHEFSDEGWAEIAALHGELMVSARLACTIILSQDVGVALRLAEQKTIIRDLEKQSSARHLERLRSGVIATRETSSIHLDTLYDFKEINALLVELAYPLLESAGHLRETRLRQVK